MKLTSRGFFGFQSRWVVPAVLLLVMVFGAGSVLAANPFKPSSNLSSRLDALSKNLTRSANNQVSLKDLGLSASGPMSLVKDAKGQLLVYIKVTDTGDEQTSALTGNGATITHVSDKYNVVTAYVSTSRLETIAALPFVKYVSEVVTPMLHQADCTGAITSEGDAQLKADQARTANSIDGTGVTVGVLSDSYSGVTTPTSAADDIASGDLPGVGNPCLRTTPVNVVSAYTGTSPSDEGRGMLQIVHDLAPGASLAFASAFNGFYEFADNIVALRTAGADIIVDDVSYYAEPFYQDGPISVAIAQVVADGAQYFTSAGNSNGEDGSNNNISSYEASAFRPMTCPTLTYMGSPVDLGSGGCHDFDPSATDDVPYQEIVLADQGYLVATLQWNEPWEGVVTDLDIYVTDDSNAIITGSAEPNTDPGLQMPFESWDYQNTTGANQTIRIYVPRYSGTGTPRCKYIFFRSGGVVSTSINETNNTIDTFGPSIAGHSGEDTALSIAAVPYDDSSIPESFTSHGYFTVYYGPVKAQGAGPASALASPETRQKPDVAATDGGANTFFGQQDPSLVWRFYGTSAAAPHAAAVGALISQMYYNTYGLMPTQAIMETSLETTAATIAGGSQISTGAGLIDAVAALAEALTHETKKTSGSSSSGGCFISVFDKE